MREGIWSAGLNLATKLRSGTSAVIQLARIGCGNRCREIVGRAIKKFTGREQIVPATKVFFTTMHDGTGRAGLSRRAIVEGTAASLTRLGTDYVDLHQIHRFDPETPVEETVEALHDVVGAGKARYIGRSSPRRC